ncbi:MAG TPA: DsbA family oxidoreductase [Puia sp.]|nr:DsbA family oxidoreductase [Puia sp.]
MDHPKMKVEVWSDIMCPFCYIGKRNYESALSKFENRDNIEIEWRSFQLDPTIPKNSPVKVNVYKYLADKKGISYEQSTKMHEQVIQMAKNAGLDYRFDKAIVANSFDAHRMIQLAKEKGLGDASEERLFRAYFTEGKDFGDHETLVSLGKEIGLPAEEIKSALVNDVYAEKVEQDIQEAAEIGIQGVPFFVFDRKYAVSGAQPPEHFLQALNQSFGEWGKDNPVTSIDVEEGAVCKPGEDCI